jgi:hypothetical protein
MYWLIRSVAFFGMNILDIVLVIASDICFVFPKFAKMKQWYDINFYLSFDFEFLLIEIVFEREKIGKKKMWVFSVCQGFGSIQYQPVLR